MTEAGAPGEETTAAAPREETTAAAPREETTAAAPREETKTAAPREETKAGAQAKDRAVTTAGLSGPGLGGAQTAAVVLCWNDADRVLAFLDALAALEPAPGRVVVVDNGSAAGDAGRIEAAFGPHDVVRLPVNCGFATAANRGIGRALAHGASEVWLLNTDVELPRDALARLRRALGEPPRAGMAGAVLTTREGNVECRGGGRVSLWTGSCRHVLGADERLDYLSAACLLLRADMLRATGAFDEGYFFYWEDVELGFRAREQGWALAVAQDCRVVHDEGSTLGRWSSKRWELLFRGMMRFLRARAPLPAAAIAARLAVHSAVMLRHGRMAALAGAWRALAPRRRRS